MRDAGARPRRPAPGGAAARPHAPAPHQVRIIGGDWKRTPLAVPDVPGLRPTPDRVRETLFNWLGQRLQGLRCLDLFGGSGALGLEAASRGASSVVVVEQDRRAVEAIGRSIEKLKASQVRLLRADAIAALATLARAGERFDVVLLDPPFREGWLSRLWPRIGEVLADDARVYAESEAPLPAAITLDGQRLLEVEKADKAGQVHYHLLRCRSAAPETGGG